MRVRSKLEFFAFILAALVFSPKPAFADVCGVPGVHLCTISGGRAFAYARLKNDPAALVNEAKNTIAHRSNVCSACAIKAATFVKFADMRARNVRLNDVLRVVKEAEFGPEERALEMEFERLAHDVYRLKFDTPWNLVTKARERAMEEFASCICSTP